MPLTFPIPNTSNQSGTPTQPNTYYNTPSNYGEFQFVALDEIVDNFMATYVGEGRILPKEVLRGDANFHAHRALQELSYDTLKSCKSLEIEVCPNLKMPLPHDYVNYVKLVSVDSNGIEHILYPTSKTSNPFAVEQTQDDCTDCGDTSQTYQFEGAGLRSQEIECDAGDVTCTFTNPVSGVRDAEVDYTIFGTNLLGASQVFTAFQQGGVASFYTQQQQLDYWDAWFASVDNYCLCLKTSGSEDNCGEQLNWNNFDTTGNIMNQLQNNAGWSGLRHPVVNSNISVNQAYNGTWEEFVTNVTSSVASSNTWDNYKSASSNSVAIDSSTTTNLAVDNDNYFQNVGQRRGIDPQYAQANGSYFMDCAKGMIHFSYNLSGKTVTLHYLSDGHGTVDELIVHKFAEEAMYKWIAYGCLSSRADTPEYVVQRFKKEKFAETRKAKIRLSNIKIEEITQIMRGKSKFIDQ